MSLSIIVPVYNEESVIKNCLCSLKSLKNLMKCNEIIFADGGSTDGTLEITRKFLNRSRMSASIIHCSRKGRAYQMNEAASLATGDILWFVHADCIVPDDAITQIEEAMDSGAFWGCFRIKFDYDNHFMRCNAFNSNRRVRRWHIAFGDQGIFIRKSLFKEEGGFPEIPLMEDYELSRRLKRRKIYPFQLKGLLITSGRRYRREHPLRVMWKMFMLRCLYRMGFNASVIAEKYQDKR